MITDNDKHHGVCQLQSERSRDQFIAALSRSKIPLATDRVTPYIIFLRR